MTNKYKYRGLILTVTELMPFCAVEKKTLISRLNGGWDVEKAVTTKLGSYSNMGTKRSVNAGINAHNKKAKKISVFAQCSRRCNAK